MLTSIVSHLPPASIHELTFNVYFEDTKWGTQIFRDSFSSGWETLRVLCAKFRNLQAFAFDGGDYDLSLVNSSCEEIWETMGRYQEDEDTFDPPYSSVCNGDDPCELQWRPLDLTERWMDDMSRPERR